MRRRERRVNRHMTPDKVKVAPMAELLQHCHGSRYITTLDLSSAFLQLLLAQSSRKWTAFNFENQVYQFTRDFWIVLSTVLILRKAMCLLALC